MSSRRRNRSGGRQARAPEAGKPGSSVNSGRSPRVSGAAREVDLHLPSGHAAIDALDRQLARIRGELNSAIRSGEKEIVFIHGAGSGRLREALRDIIAAEYSLCTCHDASFTRYGYNGATAVTIRK